MSRLNGPVNNTIVDTNKYADMWVTTERDINYIASFLSQSTLVSVITQLGKSIDSAIKGFTVYPMSIPQSNTAENTAVVVAGVGVPTEGVVELVCPHIDSTLVSTKYEIKVNVPDIVPDINFLTFEPYTIYELYVPFIGLVKLDAKRILGKTITLEYVTDLRTGNSSVYISNDTETFYTNSVSIGVTLPFQYTNEGQAQISRAISAIKTGVSLGFAGGGVLTRAGGTSTYTTTYGPTQTNTREGTIVKHTERSPATGRQITMSTDPTYITRERRTSERTKTTTKNIPPQYSVPNPPAQVNSVLNSELTPISVNMGSPAGDLSQFSTALTPYLIITRTHIYDIENYGRYFGYACAEYTRLGDHTGYCEVSNVHMQEYPGLLPYEMNMIEDALKAGVIL